MSLILPPARDRADRELRRIVRHADVNMSLIPRKVVNSKGNSSALGDTGEIMLVDLLGLPTPRLSRVPERAYQFLLFRIDAADRQAGRDETLFLGRDVSELLGPFGASRPALLSLICLQREAHLLKQSANRCLARGMSLGCELFAQPTKTAP